MLRNCFASHSSKFFAELAELFDKYYFKKSNSNKKIQLLKDYTLSSNC